MPCNFSDFRGFRRGVVRGRRADMIIQVVVVASAMGLWLWLLADGADRLLKRPVFCTKRHALFASPFIFTAAIAITYRLHQPEAKLTPIPCVIDVDGILDLGIYRDVRDGLCYRRVPLEFQKR